MLRRIPVLFAALWLSAPAGAEPAARLTTHTGDYCDRLAARVAANPATAAEPSRRLAEEGVRLCGTGQVRTGIAKLRRALRAAQLRP